MSDRVARAMLTKGNPCVGEVLSLGNSWRARQDTRLADRRSACRQVGTPTMYNKVEIGLEGFICKYCNKNHRRGSMRVTTLPYVIILSKAHSATVIMMAKGPSDPS